MELGIILLKQILIMFALMLVGSLLFKKGFLSNQGSKELGNLLLYIIVPSVILKSFCVPYSEEQVKAVFVGIFLACVTLIISMLVATLVFGKRYPIYNFGVAFANAGFIGIPLVQATLGNEAVFYMAPFVALLNVGQWTYGVLTITNDKKVISFKKVVQIPALIALVIGLLLYTSQIQMPAMGVEVLNIISYLNTPIAMFICGVYLAQSDLMSIVKDKNLYIVGFFRLILIPIITVLVMSLIPGYFEVKLAILIAAGGPVGTNIAVFAKLYDKDYTLAVNCVVATTLFSIILMPIIIAWAATVL